MFRIRPHKGMTLRSWYERRDDIDFQAVYQRRGGLWTKKDKAYLIDSILNGYDIPKIYVADFRRVDSPLNEKKKMYAIIDGKQRFEAVFEFFGDKLALDKGFVYERHPELQLRGLRYSHLAAEHPHVRTAFDQYELDVVSVETDEKGKIEELFIRLNKAMRNLSGAELRNAMPGIVPILIRELAEHPFFRCRINFKVHRYQDREVAAKLLLIEHGGELVSTKKKDLHGFVKEVAQERGPRTTPYRETARRVREVLGAMAEVFVDGDALLGTQGAVPLYYWFVREHAKRHRRRIRSFLEEFEDARKENDRRDRERARGVDRELLGYSRARRSHNDAGAMKLMYSILERRFAQFLKTH